MDSYFHKAIWRDLNGVTIEFYASVGKMRRYLSIQKIRMESREKSCARHFFVLRFFNLKPLHVAILSAASLCCAQCYVMFSHQRAQILLCCYCTPHALQSDVYRIDFSHAIFLKFVEKQLYSNKDFCRYRAMPHRKLAKTDMHGCLKQTGFCRKEKNAAT
jgi:hypothetical protein